MDLTIYRHPFLRQNADGRVLVRVIYVVRLIPDSDKGPPTAQ